MTALPDSVAEAAATLSIPQLKSLVDVHIDLSKKATLLAGVNGSGKTTILRLLAMIFGWPAVDAPDEMPAIQGSWPFGPISWGRGGPGTSFRVVRGASPRPGIFVPAHRAGYVPGKVGAIDVQWIGESQLLDQIRSAEMSPTGRGSNLTLKQGLISSALFGYQSGPSVQPVARARVLFERYIEVLRLVLSDQIGLTGLIVRDADVFVATENGEFPLDGASGGTAAILDLAWQLTLASQADPEAPFLVLIDELENHLHPALQRTALPRLLAAFPTAHFVVATHSPHVFASVEDATHVVMRPVDGGFTSTVVDMPASLLTPDEVLREALGLEVTMPVWVEEKLDAIIERNNGDLLESGRYEALRDELREAGLAQLLPTATSRLLGDAH